MEQHREQLQLEQQLGLELQLVLGQHIEQQQLGQSMEQLHMGILHRQELGQQQF